LVGCETPTVSCCSAAHASGGRAAPGRGFQGDASRLSIGRVRQVGELLSAMKWIPRAAVPLVYCATRRRCDSSRGRTHLPIPTCFKMFL
jgi:hypothetical protein